MHSVLALAIVLSSLARIASANDAAASTAAGGIQLRREARISMEKERLFISEKKITVEYEFLNETDQDITTEVAFPVPPYDNDFSGAGGWRGIDDFRVWVDGLAVKYQIEAKATLRGNDVSIRLRQLGIDVASFGHSDHSSAEPNSPDVERLSRRQQNELIRDGLIDPDLKLANWTVTKTYHWQETFPARKVLHVRHEYRPVLGFEQMNLEDSQGKRIPRFANISGACVDLPLRKKLVTEAAPSDGWFPTFWIDYILTTANTWKKPIKQFELIVEKPQPDGTWRVGRAHWYVSFCWDGKVEQPDSNHFVARARNFVPVKELHVMFLGPGN